MSPPNKNLKLAGECVARNRGHRCRLSGCPKEAGDGKLAGPNFQLSCLPQLLLMSAVLQHRTVIGAFLGSSTDPAL
jgi:hypothetical protein